MKPLQKEQIIRDLKAISKETLKKMSFVVVVVVVVVLQMTFAIGTTVLGAILIQSCAANKVEGLLGLIDCYIYVSIFFFLIDRYIINKGKHH